MGFFLSVVRPNQYTILRFIQSHYEMCACALSFDASVCWARENINETENHHGIHNIIYDKMSKLKNEFRKVKKKRSEKSIQEKIVSLD